MKFSTRELVIMAVFGVLWGIVEISLGTVLKSLNVPLSGVVLAAIGMAVAITGRLFVPRKGSTLFIGVIALILKLFSLGGVILTPMIAILSEALIAELVLSLSGNPSRFSFILAGGLSVLWSLPHPFIMGPIFFGRSVLVVWLDLLDRGRRLFGLSTEAAWLIILIIAAIHLVIGGLAGLFAWEVGKQLQARMGITPVKSTQS